MGKIRLGCNPKRNVAQYLVDNQRFAAISGGYELTPWGGPRDFAEDDGIINGPLRAVFETQTDRL